MSTRLVEPCGLLLRLRHLLSGSCLARALVAPVRRSHLARLRAPTPSGLESEAAVVAGAPPTGSSVSDGGTLAGSGVGSVTSGAVQTCYAGEACELSFAANVSNTSMRLVQVCALTLAACS